VVLDALHHVQKHQAPDLAVRWNCKAGKCGSCSAEVNGKPRLTCKTRMDSLPQDQPITIFPMKSFPVTRTSSPTSHGTTKSIKRFRRLHPKQMANGRCIRKMWTVCRSSA